MNSILEGKKLVADFLKIPEGRNFTLQFMPVLLVTLALRKRTRKIIMYAIRKDR